MSKPSNYTPRHYDTDVSRAALRRTDWTRAWLLLGTQMERGSDVAAEAAFAVVTTATDLGSAERAA